MGTSTSYRSPATPRWSGFVAALLGDVPVERVRSELFNAGNDWQEALANPAVASFASSIADLYESFSEQLAHSQRPDLVVGHIALQAKDRSATEGFSSAIGLAERAFIRTIIATLGGIPRQGEEADTIAGRWNERRGASSIEITARFAGEVLGQFARHAVDREAGRLAVVARGGEAAAISERVAEECSGIARTAAEASLGGGVSTATWALTVNRAFEAGRAIPDSDR
jgi:hypothetical protein